MSIRCGLFAQAGILLDGVAAARDSAAALGGALAFGPAEHAAREEVVRRLDEPAPYPRGPSRPSEHAQLASREVLGLIGALVLQQVAQVLVSAAAEARGARLCLRRELEIDDRARVAVRDEPVRFLCEVVVRDPLA